MKRDFSEAARQELLSLVSQVEDEKWCDFTDWVGDRWYDFEDWIGKLDISNYISNVNDYHKKVIDKNNATASDINTIFESVNNVSEQYKRRFVLLHADLQEYRKQIDLLSKTIEPGNGSFNSEFIGSGLKDAINKYLQTSNDLQMIVSGDLPQEDVTDPSKCQRIISTLQRILDNYAVLILDSIPNVKIGDEMEIPIGPSTYLYCKVSGKINGTGDIDLNYIVQEQKLLLKDCDYTYDSGKGISASIGTEGNVSVENKIGDNTYSYNLEIDVFKQEFAIEESVTADIEGGSVSTTIGIKYSNDPWKRLPEPVSVESPHIYQIPDFMMKWKIISGLATATVPIPDFDIDRQIVGGVVTIAGTVYALTKIAALALIPATGGTSGVLLAF